MKFFIVTCLKEYQEEVCKIFREAKINVFSATEIVGFKHHQSADMLSEWFASGDEKFDSAMLFSFTAEKNTGEAIALIKKFNDTTDTNFPVQAFVVPVETSIY